MTAPTILPRPDNPLIVQADRSLLLHTVRTRVDASGQVARDENGAPLTEEHPRYAEARDALSQFAELEKSPDYLHSYRLTPISIWNAAALGMTADDVERQLHELTCVPIPPNVLVEIRGWFQRYGLLRIERRDPDADGGSFELVSSDPDALADALGHRTVRDLVRVDDSGRAFLDELGRGPLKQALIRVGYPVEDLGGYREGDAYPIELRDERRAGGAFALRDYQRSAAEAFYQGGAVSGGSGVVVLPCGAGKTVVALGAMSLVREKTLILTSNTVAVRQWKSEILDKTTLDESEVGEYTGETKEVAPVTITTYQMLTWRRSKTGDFEHFEIFGRENWGLVVYDEVHLLPAPIFRVTAELQARRRLGLTATLVREDGREDEVFCLIGPKRAEVPWRVLERQGFIAPARCIELRIPLPIEHKRAYEGADARRKFRIASENPRKLDVAAALIEKHRGDRILVIGQYLDQLKEFERRLGLPLITGKTPNADRERLYADFRAGREPVLIVSKVGNFAIDLPDANVAIQISGTFGSRQEEAQRLGRVLRPKDDGGGAAFYALVSHGTKDQEFAQKRQLFLTEQGYSYEIVEIPAGDGPVDLGGLA
ncbi:MAG: helicase-associated domain-containing protein [Planctomycetota bacterium]